MLRIVGGTARGRRLVVPPGGTRPTSDRAREALFNTVATYLDLDGTRVLELFAGSGAVGIEALSRGAELVVFVESDRAAARVLAANLVRADVAGGSVLRCTAQSYLVAAGADEPYDLVYLDPPYALPDHTVAALLASLDDARWVRVGGLVVVERSARGADLSWPTGIETLKEKRYGEAVLWYGRRR